MGFERVKEKKILWRNAFMAFCGVCGWNKNFKGTTLSANLLWDRTTWGLFGQDSKKQFLFLGSSFSETVSREIMSVLLFRNLNCLAHLLFHIFQFFRECLIFTIASDLAKLTRIRKTDPIDPISNPKLIRNYDPKLTRKPKNRK